MGLQERDVGSDVIERKLQEDTLGNCPSHSMCDKIKAGPDSLAMTLPPLAKTNFCAQLVLLLLLTLVVLRHCFFTITYITA